MRKVKLELDQLEVASFATVKEAGARRGTVRGREFTEEWNSNCCNPQSYSYPACYCAQTTASQVNCTACCSA